MDLDSSYKVLGLRADADISEIRNAYRRLALQYHPDRNNGPEATKTFADINEAYNTIIHSALIGGGAKNLFNENTLDEESTKISFSILSDKERVYRVSRMRYESELRKYFNPNLASGIYCKVGERWFEIDGERRSAWSPFRWGSGRGSGLIEWGNGPNQDKWKSISWEEFWSYVRRHASRGLSRTQQQQRKPSIA